MVSEDIGSLTKRFEAGALRRDDNGEAMESGGFVVTWWNGEETAPARLSPDVGMAGARQVNAVVLELPTLVDVPWLYQPEVAMEVLAAIQSAWEPEWATWTTDRWRDAQLAEPRTPVVGWLTYVSHVTPAGLPATWRSFLQPGDQSSVQHRPSRP